MYNVMEYANETLLGSGCRRDVYVYDDTSVLKVEQQPNSTCVSSRSEITVWNMVKDTEDARHFAAIFEYTNDGYIRMERVERTGDAVAYDDVRPYYRLLNEIASKYDVTDMHMGNIGQRKDGTWCIIDYGAHLPTYRKVNGERYESSDGWEDVSQDDWYSEDSRRDDWDCECSRCRPLESLPF
jgi:hypothetical protein